MRPWRCCFVVAGLLLSRCHFRLALAWVLFERMEGHDFVFIGPVLFFYDTLRIAWRFHGVFFSHRFSSLASVYLACPL